MADPIARDPTDWQAVQNFADAELEKRFLDAAGSNETEARVKHWDHGEISRLITKGVDAGVSLERKPETDSKGDKYYAYGHRVNRPGIIQNFGATLLVSAGPDFCGAAWGTVLAVSENSKEILGVMPDDLVDGDLFDSATSPFSEGSLQALRAALSSNDLSVQAPLIAEIRIEDRDAELSRAYVIAHATSEGIVIDVEPLSGNVSSFLQGSLQTHALARASVARVQGLSTATSSQLCQAMVEEASTLTGYDRVMIYKFHPDLHGEVVAEHKKEGTPDSWLGLHFPSTDIPQANRFLFSNMRARMIANVGSPSVGMVHSPRLTQNIILAGSQLRGVSGCHTQYLQNMGVTATLVMSIVTGAIIEDEPHLPEKSADGTTKTDSPLWGLLVCHHYSGQLKVNYDHRAAVEFLAKVFSIQLGRSLEAAAYAAQRKVAQTQSRILDALKHIDNPNHPSEPDSIGNRIAQTLMVRSSSSIMLKLCDATGCALFMDGSWFTVGKCPEEIYLNSLVEWLKTSGKLEIGGRFGTVGLKNEKFPDAEATKERMAGIIAADLLTMKAESIEKQAIAVWMRGELIQEEMWAGGRQSAPSAIRDTNYMTPRHSFNAVQEILSFQCAPWANHEATAVQAVQMLLQDSIRIRAEGKITSRVLLALNQERLRSMGELSKVASELKAVINAAEVPVVRVSPKFEIISCNYAAEQLLATVRDESPEGMPFVDFLKDEHRTSVQKAMERAAACSTESDHLEVKFDMKDELRSMDFSIYIHARLTVMGELDSLILMCRDMSSQKALIDSLVARERDCVELIQNSTSPMFCVDVDGRITEWSHAMHQLSGLEKASVEYKLVVGEVFGTNGMIRTLEPNNGSVATQMSAGLVLALETDTKKVGTGPLQDIHFSFLKVVQPEKPMKQVDVSLTLRPRSGPDGDVIGAFCFIQDLTVPNALEKAIAVQTATEAAAEAKTRHIAFLCHEIRNPVNGILATVQAMEEMMHHNNHNTELDMEEMYDLVKTTMACTDQLRRTVDGILDINKLEEGKLDVTTAPFRVAKVLRTVVSQVVKASEEKGLTLECQVSPELADITLIGDEGRIQQVLANFCWNSVKFTTEGKVTIVVESEPVEQAGFLLVFFKVVDTGKGMDQKTQEGLFQRYAMGQHRVGKYGGSGLGLSICRSLAELMKGHVHCVSTLGQGSTFVLELELEVDSSDEMHQKWASDQYKVYSTNSSGMLTLKEQQPSLADTGAMSHAPALGPESAAEKVTQHGSQASMPMGGFGLPHSMPGVAPSLPISGGHPGQMMMGMYGWASPIQHLASANRSRGGLDVRAVRELVLKNSVGVLIEVDLGGTLRQHWGGAQIINGNVAEALTAAQQDALHRLASLQVAQPAPQAQAWPVPGSYGHHFYSMNLPMPMQAPMMPGPMYHGMQHADVAMPMHTPQFYFSGSSPSHQNAPSTVQDQQPAPSAPEVAPEASRSVALLAKAEKAAPAETNHANGKSSMSEVAALKTVLAVDDDTVNLKVLHRALTKNSSLDVTLAEDGQDMIRLLITEGRRFDIVLLDENMQRMNGSTAAAAYRKYEMQHNFPPTPLVVTTGNSASHDLLRYHSCGIDSILAKPMTLRSLLKDISTFYQWYKTHGPHRPSGSHAITTPEELAPATSTTSTIVKKDSEMFYSSLFVGNMEVFGKLKNA